MDPPAFSDDNIGTALDRIYSYGTCKLFSELSLEAVKKFNIDTTEVHHDTTPVSIWGEYKYSENGEPLLILLTAIARTKGEICSGMLVKEEEKTNRFINSLYYYEVTREIRDIILAYF